MKDVNTFEYHGEYLTVTDLLKIATNGISKQALRYRLVIGMTAEDAISKPVGRKIKRDGEPFPCGAVNPFDCLDCPYERMPCLSWPVMNGESLDDYSFKDYNKPKRKKKRSATMTIGEQLRSRREELGKTGAALSRETGVQTCTISMIENSKTNPSLSTLVKLCNALGAELTLKDKGDKQNDE